MIRWLIFFTLFSSFAFGQQMVVSTIVDAESGAPVPFASIGIVGTSKGTSSNLNGQFSISISEPVLFQVTCIGYETLKIYSVEVKQQIKLKPTTTRLDDIVVFDKPINVKKIIRKAFASIPDNYDNGSFLQKFFYRHYCKDNDVYGRLIEASIDVWKNRGYSQTRIAAGTNEGIRITQLRRSLDKTELAQGHEPISVENILEADLVGYQAAEISPHLTFYNTVSNLKVDLDSYTFNFKGITNYDGQEVYEIAYVYKKDSVITPSGQYRIRSQAKGSLFITTDNYAFIKMDDFKTYGRNTIRTLAYYRRYSGRYYPYHFIIDGESHNSDSSTHASHIELMSVEIRKGKDERFAGQVPGREELLSIPYDSVFWSSSTILKTTPLEDDIIRDLGGGISLNEQFYRYRQYELNVNDGGVNGEEKFNWLRQYSKGNRILYIVFWSSNFQSYLIELELAKRINRQYRNKITFVFLSLEDDVNQWSEAVKRYNFYTDGIINYRIGSHSKIAKEWKVKGVPYFVLLNKSGDILGNAKHPSDPKLIDDFNQIIQSK